MIPSFSIARLPQIEFGAGALGRVPQLACAFGNHALLVTGKKSLRQTVSWKKLIQGLNAAGITCAESSIGDEPSPELIDELVAQFKDRSLQMVIGIGGGSVLDAAKAIAGLLPHGNSVMDHLEGVGPELPYTGPPLPFIAIPTTAGTGSEATKNAVLSRRGANGFKKSFRDEQLVPNIAVVDPDLLATCSPPLIAANGMDALTQLLESYVSLKANPFTDALAWSGLAAARDGLLEWYLDPAGAIDARACMAYAALLSGITLAQCGLGSVHGLASPLGAFFPIPHGVVCGTLVAKCTEQNIEAMLARERDNIALEKYARVAVLFGANPSASPELQWQFLIDKLAEWTEQMSLERLSDYGISENDFAKIIDNSRGSSMKTNPVVLTDEEIGSILHARL